MERTWLVLAAVLGLTAVATGAFGAHALEARLSADDLDTYQTAARYHMYHALALIGVAYLTARLGTALVRAAGWLLVGGTLIFSGSLYLLALSGVGILGAVAPLGGACLLAGWACLGLAAWRARWPS